MLNTYVCLFREGSMNGLALMQRGLEGGRPEMSEEKLRRRRGEKKIKVLAGVIQEKNETGRAEKVPTSHFI